MAKELGILAVQSATDDAQTGSSQAISPISERPKADEMETSECGEKVRPAPLTTYR